MEYKLEKIFWYQNNNASNLYKQKILWNKCQKILQQCLYTRGTSHDCYTIKLLSCQLLRGILALVLKGKLYKTCIGFRLLKKCMLYF